MSDKIMNENLDRYGGFADLYNLNRPVPPIIITDIIQMYSSTKPRLVVDIGSGTGLSTFIWKHIAPKVVGIEPDDNMRKTAESSVKSDNITFQKGFSNDTGLISETVDVVTISQALHWMDIDSTFDEVYRILGTDGVFAVYDCAPPSVDWIVEKEFNLLRAKCDRIALRKEKPSNRNNKSTRIDTFRVYGKFIFVKEITCHSVETCTRERLLGIVMTQGNIQQALKMDSSIQTAIDKFYDVVKSRCKEKFDIVFSYNLRIAIK
ncbi:class I SAM-dependent methyltransferase [Clostridium sp. E02]|uniref:class I SAM-dependent methyltransferase n=1 Tax=Clostridium sp. E02 TaxID=2487134 RepID=UPI000F5353CB|nr:class I SAM-dependent methyltransferase [Clostridium sp. E02]